MQLPRRLRTSPARICRIVIALELRYEYPDEVVPEGRTPMPPREPFVAYSLQSPYRAAPKGAKYSAHRPIFQKFTATGPPPATVDKNGP